MIQTNNVKYQPFCFDFDPDIPLFRLRRTIAMGHSTVINEPDTTLSPRNVGSALVASVCTKSIVSSLKQNINIDELSVFSNKFM